MCILQIASLFSAAMHFYCLFTSDQPAAHAAMMVGIGLVGWFEELDYFSILLLWDPLVLFAACLVNKLELTEEEERYSDEWHAVAITCHNSSDVIAATLDNILMKVDSHLVFVADNGSSDAAETAAICSERGVYYGCMILGNKTLAQYATARYLAAIGVKLVTFLDDDTRLHPSWAVHKINKYFADDATAALAYPLSVDDQPFQNIEYLVTGFYKLAQSTVGGTTIFSSGASGTYRVDKLLDALRDHDTQFIGDDLQIGINIHRAGYKIKAARDMAAITIAPSCVFHSRDCQCGNPSLFDQRCRSWFLSRNLYVIEKIKLAFSKGGWLSIFLIYDVLETLADLFKLTILYYSGLGGIVLANAISTGIYIQFHAVNGLPMDFSAILLFTPYKLLLNILNYISLGFLVARLATDENVPPLREQLGDKHLLQQINSMWRF